METSPIVHEWFYPEGPDTFEYLLPVAQFSRDHRKLLPEWTLDFAFLTTKKAKQRFDEYLDSIALPEISAFTKIAETLFPYSVVVHETESWLLCKSESQFDGISAHGNMLQLPAPHNNLEWPAFFDPGKFNSLKQFLRYFGGTRIDIPPTSGIISPSNMQPVAKDPETYAWKNTQNWDGAYPVYNVGNGDVVLVDSNCKFGTWYHELCGDPKGAVQELGSFAQFIEFVANDTGIVR